MSLVGSSNTIKSVSNLILSLLENNENIFMLNQLVREKKNHNVLTVCLMGGSFGPLYHFI